MKEVGRTKVEKGAGNKIYELTRDDELFLIGALRIAEGFFWERARTAVQTEGRDVNDPQVEVLRRASTEFAMRAGYLGMDMESAEYEGIERIVYDRAKKKVENDEPLAGVAPHYTEPAAVSAS